MNIGQELAPVLFQVYSGQTKVAFNWEFSDLKF